MAVPLNAHASIVQVKMYNVHVCPYPSHMDIHVVGTRSLCISLMYMYMCMQVEGFVHVVVTSFKSHNHQ